MYEVQLRVLALQELDCVGPVDEARVCGQAQFVVEAADDVEAEPVKRPGPESSPRLRVWAAILRRVRLPPCLKR